MKRGWTISLLVVGGSGGAFGQSAYPVVAQSITTLQQQGKLPAPIGTPPLQPQGFPGPGPSMETLPPGIPEQQNFRLVSAGVGGRSGNNVDGREGVEFWYKGYHVFADDVDGSLQTNIFTLRHHVKVLGKDSTVVGDRVTVNFDNNTYLAEDAISQIAPKMVGGNLRDNLYVKAAKSYGSEREIWTDDGDLTTCNLPEPHYHLEVAGSDIRTGKRAILRHTKIILFGRTLVNIPFVSIPLDDPSHRYTPEIGRSDDEGYYIKTRFGIPLRGNDVFDARLDYMTKLGVGVGGDYRYVNRDMNGILRVYKIFGNADTFTFSNDHRQQFKFGTLTLNNDYQKDNYLTAPGTTLLTSRAQLAIPSANGGSTRINFTGVSSNSSGGFSTSNETFSLSDQHRFGKTTTSLDVSYQENKSVYQETSSDRRQIDVRFQGSQDLNKATANFEYMRTIPVGQTEGLFSSADRTPFLSLNTDSRRLIGDKFAQTWPFDTELSYGEFSNSFSENNDHVGRYIFDVRLNKPDRSTKRFRMDVSAEFKQGLYTDDTAQYTHALNLNASYSLGKDTAANLRYNYLRQYGYTPVSLDSTGRMNLFSADVSYRPTPPLLVAAQTGYDLVRLDQQTGTPWNQVGVRTEYTPLPNLMFRTYSNYDTFQRAWSSVRLDLAFKRNDFFLALGSQFDGINHTWTSTNLYLQNLVWGRTKLSAILSYNGFSRQLDGLQLNMIYDLHCAEAIISYSQSNYGFRSGRDISIFIRLKALPFDLPFGFGTRGQPFGTPVGSGS